MAHSGVEPHKTNNKNNIIICMNDLRQDYYYKQKEFKCRALICIRISDNRVPWLEQKFKESHDKPILLGWVWKKYI